MRTTGKLLITSGGLGFMRPAPGTWGSLPPCVLALGLVLLRLDGTVWWFASMGLVTLFFSWVCVAFGDGAEAAFGRKDPSQVVADETAGMALTLMFVPMGVLRGQGAGAGGAGHEGLAALVPLVAGIGVAFVLFRVADILKLWPANGLQRLRGGWGILVDDLVAGVQAGVVAHLSVFVWHVL